MDVRAHIHPDEVYPAAADFGLWLALLVVGAVLLAYRRRAGWADTRAVTVAAVAGLLVPIAHLAAFATDAVIDAEVRKVMNSEPPNGTPPEDFEYVRRLGTAIPAVAWAVRGLDAAAVLAVGWAVAAGRRPGHSPPGA